MVSSANRSAGRFAELTIADHVDAGVGLRSEEHTSELQSLRHLVCRLLLEKKKTIPRPDRNRSRVRSGEAAANADVDLDEETHGSRRSVQVLKGWPVGGGSGRMCAADRIRA